MSANFRQKGASPTNHSWCQETRVIALSSDIKYRQSLFGFVTKHRCDRRTDRGTDGQNYDSQDRASTLAGAVKTVELTANMSQL